MNFITCATEFVMLTQNIYWRTPFSAAAVAQYEVSEVVLLTILKCSRKFKLDYVVVVYFLIGEGIQTLERVSLYQQAIMLYMKE
jgi:hypothetical protein